MENLSVADGPGIVKDVIALQNTVVFVVGDLILDIYTHGTVDRISPEAPVPVLRTQSRRQVLGGAGNVAANIAALGGRVCLSGRLGHDEAGDGFVALAESHGISTAAVVRSEAVRTTQKNRIQAGAQQMMRLDEEEMCPLTEAEEQWVLMHFERFCSDATSQRSSSGGASLVISDYDKGVLSETLIGHLIDAARERQIPVITDPKKADLSVYRGSTVVKPNRKEAMALPALSAVAGRGGSSGGLRHDDAIRLLVEASEAENIVLSLSAEGVVCGGLATNHKVRHFPSAVLNVSDVSGAGDTVVSVLAMGLAARLSLERSTELGNVAAGLVCAKQGTATITASELIQGYHLSDGEHVTEKIVSLEAAAELSRRLQRDGRKVVFTNGCFDILHPGHVHSLAVARKQGHFLIVGLNSDRSVRQLKGETRPVQDQASRALVLAGLGSVDFVVVFDEADPAALIQKIRPNVLVKGGDYKEDDIVGAKEVKAWGGRVLTVPLVPDQSTTSILERSREKQK